MKKLIEIEETIKSLPFEAAIEWCVNELGAKREPMGHNSIARMKVERSDINAIQFYNYYGYDPSKKSVSFNFNQ